MKKLLCFAAIATALACAQFGWRAQDAHAGWTWDEGGTTFVVDAG